MIIRQLDISDYERLCALWKSCKLELGTSDSHEEIARFMEQNPSTCLGGVEDGVLVASVLGGFDGRRGLVHHLAVDPLYQKRGYGMELMQVLEAAFKELEVVKLSFWVKTNNLGVIDFYNKLGYETRQDIVTMSKSLKEE